ncbi:MAG: hypothetical protein ACREPI_03890, partial [Candidatus Dormibacterales bacterium]
MAYLLAAPAVLAGAALISWGLAAARLDAGRTPAAAGAWGALAVTLLGWDSAHAVTEIALGPVGSGAALGLRLDPLTLAFQIAVLAPVALILTVRPLGGGEAGLCAAAACAALLAVEARGLLLTASGLGAAATLALLVLRLEGRATGRWSGALGASLALAWAGILLLVGAGTDEYAAIPVSALAGPTFGLIAAGALVTAGTLPWRTWLVDALAAGDEGAIPAALLLPLGLYVLARTYAAGGGHYPSPWLNLVISAVGAGTVLAASIRAQAAPDRAAFTAEAAVAGGGFALFGLGLGTPLGLTAGVAAAMVAALAAAAAALSPRRGVTWFVPALLLAAGAPPGLTFGARLVALQGGFEARGVTAFFAIAAVAGWALLLAASARALRLPPGPGGGSRWGAGLCAVALAAGAGLGLLESGLAVPAAGAVMGGPSGLLDLAPESVPAASGTWAALMLGGPLMAAAAIAAAFRPAWRGAPADEEAGP